MADYDESGNPIPPADAQAAREASLGDASAQASTADTQSAASGFDPNYVSPDVVTVTAPKSNWLGLILVAGLLYFLMSGDDA